MNRNSFFKKKLAGNSQFVFLLLLAFIFSLSFIDTAKAKDIIIGTSADNVGIGTSSPLYKLDVSGNIRIGSTAAEPHLMFNRLGYNYIQAPTSGLISFITNGRSAAVANSSLILDTSGNSIFQIGSVGIGTTAPGAKLDVAGSLRVQSPYSATISGLSGTAGRTVMVDASGTLYATSSAIVSGIPAAGTLGQTLYSNGSSWVAATTPLFNDGNNIGIGTTNPQYKLQLNQSDDTHGIRVYGSTVPSSYFDIYINNLGNPRFETDGTHSMIFTGGGGIGFRTQGTGNLTFNDTASGPILFNNGQMVITTTGNVGIGTTAPGAKLDVAGSLRVQSPYSATISGLSGTAGRTVMVDASGTLYATSSAIVSGVPAAGALGQTLYSNGSGWVASVSPLFNNGTNVGIGTTSPSAALDIFSKIKLTSGGTIYNTDSSRWLDVTGTLSDSLKVSGGIYSTAGELKADGTGVSYVMGNLGIGTTNPGAKLEVAGLIKLNSGAISDTIYASNTNGIILESQGNKYGTVRLILQNINGLNGALFQNVGQDLVDFSFRGSSNAQQNIRFEHRAGSVYTGNSAGQFEIGPADSENLFVGAGTSGFKNGNVGIGTTDPTDNLYVSGNTTISGIAGCTGTESVLKTDASGRLVCGTITGGVTGSGTANYVTRWTAANTLGTGVLYDNGSNVGIGTTNPVAKLNVDGNIVQTIYHGNNMQLWFPASRNGGGTGDASLYLWISEPNTSWTGGGIARNMYNASGFPRANTSLPGQMMHFTEAGNIEFVTENSDGVRNTPLTALNNGNVGIGSTAPAFKLDVAGTGQFTQPLIVGTPTADNHAVTKSYLDSALGDPVGAGTAGQTLRNDGNGWVANSNLFNNGTNIGIGTTNPGAKLEVAGLIKLNSGAISDTIYASNTNGIILESQGNQYGTVRLILRNISGLNGALFQNVGQDLVDFGFRGSSDAQQNIRFEHRAGKVYTDNSAGQFEIGPADSENLFVGAGTSGFKNGNVGIGTTDPTDNLYVSGNTTISGIAGCTGTESVLKTDASGRLVCGTITGGVTGSGTANYVTRWTAANTLGTGVLYDNGSNVGIGTTGPGVKLDVAGTSIYGAIRNGSLSGGNNYIYAYSGASNKIGFWAAGNNNIVSNSDINFVTGFGFDDAAFGSNRMVIQNGGNVGIGTTAPGSKLEVVGDTKAQSFTYSSDRNLKYNIKTVDNALTKILKLRGVTFNWKSDNTKSVGLIAQEVEQVFPELVSGNEGNKGVEYGNLVGPLIEAVKEQQKEIDNLQHRVLILEKKAVKKTK